MQMLADREVSALLGRQQLPKLVAGVPVQELGGVCAEHQRTFPIEIPSPGLKEERRQPRIVPGRGGGDPATVEYQESWVEPKFVPEG